MLTYEQFKEEYQEIDIDKITFLKIQDEVLRKVNYVTFNRINFEEKAQLEIFVKLLISILLSLYSKNLIVNRNNNNEMPNKIKSETIGEYKKEYFTPTTKELNENEKGKEINDIIYQAIKETYGHTGLMYRGFYYDEIK